MSDEKNNTEDNKSSRKTDGRIKKKRKRITEGDEKASKKSQKIEQSKEIDDEEIEGVQKKPEEPSKRQLKREKAEKKQALQKEASQIGAAQKAITYISKWKHAKSDWKFEKLRQIWLMEHLLDDTLLPDSIFPITLEYFEGCKGMARQQLVKKMMEVIRKVEDLQVEEKDDDEESPDTNTSEYQRARQVLQALPTEG